MGPDSSSEEDVDSKRGRAAGDMGRGRNRRGLGRREKESNCARSMTCP